LGEGKLTIRWRRKWCEVVPRRFESYMVDSTAPRTVWQFRLVYPLSFETVRWPLLPTDAHFR